MAGLEPTGLTIKRLPEILEDIQTSERQNIDNNISTEDDTLLGQINSIFSAAISEVWELSQAVYDSSNIDKAEEKNLDDLATLRNVRRISSSKSNTTRQQFVGENGTTVPLGSFFSNPITGDRFKNPTAIVIDSSACLSANLEVTEVLNSTEYSIVVNSTTYTSTSDSDATVNEILSDFETQINADSSATWTANLASNVLTISSDDTTNISVSVVTYISISSVTVEGEIEAEETGAVIAPTGAITNIISVIPGLTSTVNNAALVLGRERETDEELRTRIKNSANADCTGTIPSIETAILNNVAGVTSVSITENVTAETDGAGRPPHSYETVVVGGNNSDIGEEIWRTKPAGIKLHGNTNVVIVDSNGNNRSIDFTRPSAVHTAVRVSYTTYGEETYPVGGDATIKSTVASHINSLGLDVDVITGRMFGPIYSAVEGINELTVEIQTLANQGDTPSGGSWSEDKISIDSDEYASTIVTDITVQDVT